MENRFFKNNLGRTEIRLLAAATGWSILIHAAVIGGWVWWGSAGRGAPRAEPGAAAIHEIHVQLRRSNAAAKDPGAAPAAPTAVSKEQSARTRSRALPIRSALALPVPAEKLLNDPETGLIFSASFKAVKSRLSHAAAVSGFKPGQTVSAHFVLSRDGRVAAVSALGTASPAVQTAVRNLLGSASPFPPFPALIRHATIAFDVLFRFDENVLG